MSKIINIISKCWLLIIIVITIAFVTNLEQSFEGEKVPTRSQFFAEKEKQYQEGVTKNANGIKSKTKHAKK